MNYKIIILKYIFVIDLSTSELFKSICNDDKDTMDEKIPNLTATANDQIVHDDFSINDEQLNQSNVTLNSESNQEQQCSNESSETPSKTNSRPQRQAAKKAENQIRVIYNFFKNISGFNTSKNQTCLINLHWVFRK